MNRQSARAFESDGAASATALFPAPSLPVRAPAPAFLLAPELPPLTVPREPQGLERAASQLLDRGVAFGLIVLLSPLLLVVAALVRLTSRGPVLFSQARIGLGGRHFRMLKFRSMRSDAERHEDALAGHHKGPFFKVHGDARVTAVGRILRRLSIDELPQLLNVLRGEMSLVGPRPLLVREHRHLPADAQIWRCAVMPGVTGLWQVSGRSSTTPATRLRLDRLYVQNAGLGLDLRILARTPAAVLRTREAV